MSMNEDIAKHPIFMVNTNGVLKQIYSIKSTDDYNHYVFDLHHFVPQTIRKNNIELYEKIVHLQKLILLPKNVHMTLHNCSDSFNYYGLKWWQLLFSRKKWRNGVYGQMGDNTATKTC